MASENGDDGYYRARDLPNFPEMGQEAPELAGAFFRMTML